MTLWKWTSVAASDDTADATINWQEGQAPSTVNNSARAMMAATAKYRDDIAGVVSTGGTNTAYTLTTNQSFDTLAHMNGAMIAFTVHSTNAGTTTINVDGLGAKPLRSAPSTEITSGVLVTGVPYVATYYNATNEWILQGFYGSIAGAAAASTLAAVSASTFTVTSNTTPANITGLSITLTSSKTYVFDAFLMCTTGASAGGIQAQIGGTATATTFRADGWALDGTTVISGAQQVVLPTVSPIVNNLNAGTTPKIYISGSIGVNSGGTLTVQFAQNTSSGTASLVRNNSYLRAQSTA